MVGLPATPNCGGATNLVFMSTNSLASSERAALANLCDVVGPDAPTLCAGWDTRDLVAHLVVREARPDASIGIVVPQLAGWTDRVQAGAAEQPYPELVDKVRNGPPRLSFFALPGVDAMANTMEYFIHHEDIRRAQPDWSPRDLSADARSQLWRALTKSAKMLLRNSLVKATMQPTDVPGHDQGEITETSVTLRGPVSEIALHLFGRDATLGLEILGPPEDVERYLAGKRGV